MIYAKYANTFDDNTSFSSLVTVKDLKSNKPLPTPPRRRVVFFDESKNTFHRSRRARKSAWYTCEDYKAFRSETREAVKALTEEEHIVSALESLYDSFCEHQVAESLISYGDDALVDLLSDKGLELLGLEKFVSSFVSKSLMARRDLIQDEVYELQEETLQKHVLEEALCEICYSVSFPACMFSLALAQAQAYST